jgi:hypothetical protein
MEKDLRTANGPIRHLEFLRNFNKRHLPTTCLDCFVFPYSKNNVFKISPNTIPELMQVITNNCNLIDVPTLRRSFENMKRSTTLWGSLLNKHAGVLNLLVSLLYVRKFFYNRQVTHNLLLYENQDFNVLKIINLTFKTDI